MLFGDGPLRPADWSLKSWPTACRAAFTSPVFHSDLDKYYPHLDVLDTAVLTPRVLPNVVLEAFAAGVPVVATAVGGTPKAVLHGVNGYLVEAGNSLALAGRIADMLSDPGEAKGNGNQWPALRSPRVLLRRPGKRIPAILREPNLSRA